MPKLATGEAIGTFALAEAPGRPSVDNLDTRASGDATDTALTGSKIAVPDGDVADFAVVVAASDASEPGDSANWYLVELDQPAVVRKPIETFDSTRSHAQIEFKGAGIVLGVGNDHRTALIVGPGPDSERLLDRAAVLFAWEQVGGADAALEMAKEYALGRYAFGRPIASYQAIKHKLANVYIKNTLARSNCYYGAWALNADSDELPLAAATARVAAIQACNFAAKENIQTHGGMGFTWEFDCQFYYRRAKLLSVNIGSEAFWQDRLMRAVERRDVA